MEKVTRKHLFASGLLKPGQVCQIINQPETAATILSRDTVKYLEREMSFNSWLKEVTGWGGVSIFQKCELVDIDTLENIRRRYLGLEPIHKNHYRKRNRKT